MSNEAAGRHHPENELLAHPAVRIAVGLREADIVGNDNRAIQAAVDYVAQLGGGMVEVRAGEYRMRDPLGEMRFVGTAETMLCYGCDRISLEEPVQPQINADSHGRHSC